MSRQCRQLRNAARSKFAFVICDCCVVRKCVAWVIQLKRNPVQMDQSRRCFGLPLTRREMLIRCANGFGAVALLSQLAQRNHAGNSPLVGAHSLAPRAGHHFPRAKSVIFLFMDGGPSQVDTFDPKPRLDREHGQPIKIKAPPTQFIPHDSVPKVMRSPWTFQRYGQSGASISELFPHLAKRVDDIAIVRSIVGDFAEHANANLFLHTGFNQQGRPSMGACVSYGLGAECQNLPGFIVLSGGRIPAGGPHNFQSGFLPAVYQS